MRKLPYSFHIMNFFKIGINVDGGYKIYYQSISCPAFDFTFASGVPILVLSPHVNVVKFSSIALVKVANLHGVKVKSIISGDEDPSKSK